MEPVNLVALIDDDELVNFIGTKVIENTHLARKIKSFLNGQDAIDFLKANRNHPDLLPEIILLDINMPVMDGFQFLEEYVKLEPNLDKTITIYVVSSSISQADFEKIKQICVVSDFIVKPITKEKFMKIVEALNYSDLV
ncbi:response regulator [Sphingobacteriaceae bacterium]|nr:response regulator [Sphingobacteriaceae bacterium]